MQRRTRSDEVVKAFLFHGVAGVQKLAEERGGISRKVLRQAMRELDANQADFGALERWCRSTHGFGLSNRGKPGPTMGDTRTYAVLQTKGGGPFVRVPVSIYDVEVGDSVSITFEPSGPRFNNVRERP